MAYAFDSLQQLAGGQGGDMSGNANIFQPTTSTTSSQGQGGAPGSTIKTSTAGDLSGGASSAQPGASSSSVTQAAPKADPNAAYAANVGKTTIPGQFQGIQNQINTASTNLQNSANAYLATDNAPGLGYAATASQGNVNSAVGGNLDAQQSLKDLFNTPPPSPTAGAPALNEPIAGPDGKPADLGTIGTNHSGPGGFIVPGGANVAPNIPDAYLAGSDAGIRNLLSRGQGPSYTQGMGAFDQQVLGSKPEFQNLIGGINSSNKTLNDNYNTDVATLPGQWAAAVQKDLTNAQDTARSSLTKAGDKITTDEQKSADDANARLAAEQKAGSQDPGVKAAEQKAITDQITKAQGDLSASDPRVAAMLSGQGFNADPYVQYNQTPYTPSQYITADQAARFNAIQKMLGLGGHQEAAFGAPPPDYTINTDGPSGLYNGLVSAAKSGRLTKDTLDNQQIAAIQGSGADLAKQIGSRAIDPASIPALAKQLEDENKPVGGELGNPNAGVYTPGMVDATPFIRANSPTIDPNNVYTAAQAQQLNDLSKDLGLQNTPYHASTLGSLDPNQLGYKFDLPGYRAALNSALETAAKAAELQPTAISTAPAGQGMFGNLGSTPIMSGIGGGSAGPVMGSFSQGGLFGGGGLFGQNPIYTPGFQSNAGSFEGSDIGGGLSGGGGSFY